MTTALVSSQNKDHPRYNIFLDPEFLQRHSSDHLVMHSQRMSLMVDKMCLFAKDQSLKNPSDWQNTKNITLPCAYGDIALIAEQEPQHVVYAHREILQAGSTWFENLFKYSPESETQVVIVQDVSHTALVEVIRFIYSGVPKVNLTNCIECALAAEKLQLRFMVKLCLVMGVANMSAENVGPLYDIANRNRIESVKAQICSAIGCDKECIKSIIEDTSLHMDTICNILKTMPKFLDEADIFDMCANASRFTAGCTYDSSDIVTHSGLNNPVVEQSAEDEQNRLLQSLSIWDIADESDWDFTALNSLSTQPRVNKGKNFANYPALEKYVRKDHMRNNDELKDNWFKANLHENRIALMQVEWDVNSVYSTAMQLCVPRMHLRSRSFLLPLSADYMTSYRAKTEIFFAGMRWLINFYKTDRYSASADGQPNMVSVDFWMQMGKLKLLHQSYKCYVDMQLEIIDSKGEVVYQEHMIKGWQNDAKSCSIEFIAPAHAILSGRLVFNDVVFASALDPVAQPKTSSMFG